MPAHRCRRAPRALAALAATLALAAGCGATRTSLTQVWQAPLEATPPMKRMIVFGARMDEASRRSLEDALTHELARHGVEARPSYAVFPGEPPREAEARAKVDELGFEGILVATSRGVTQKLTHVPAYTGNFWSTYYGSGWATASPGYLVTDEIVTFEVSLWDTRAEDRMIWAALLKTTNPSSGERFVESLTDAVVPELARVRLIAPERKRD